MFEEMANTLVENLTGMTIDQIKGQMVVVQQKVLDTIKMIDENFQKVSLRLDSQLKMMQVSHQSISDQLNVVAKAVDQRPTEEMMKAAHHATTGIICDRLEMLLTNSRMILAEQANTLTHIAQISFKLGLDLTPDLLEQLTKAATAGASSTFSIPPASTTERNGEGKLGPALSQPGDSPFDLGEALERETKAGDVIHARDTATD